MWISFRDYIYNNKPCELVHYDTGVSRILPCFVKDANMQNCIRKWFKRSYFGFCEKYDKWESWVTFCGDDYNQSPSYTMANAQVLCLAKTTRREVTIYHVDDLNSGGNVLTTPDTVLQGI